MSQFSFDKRTEHGEIGNGEWGEYDRWFIRHGNGPMCFVELTPGSITDDEARRLVALLNKHDFAVGEPTEPD